KQGLWFMMTLVESELLTESEAALEKAKIVTPEPIEIEDHAECQKAGKCLHRKPGKKKAHHE
ncbi:MAG TPA: hypothetical protein VNX68_04455, partial [Nitrosopumilaceae archaeon]|nr:hypothetical protein [Nitrosopumilaceae archaeon]